MLFYELFGDLGIQDIKLSIYQICKAVVSSPSVHPSIFYPAIFPVLLDTLFLSIKTLSLEYLLYPQGAIINFSSLAFSGCLEIPGDHNFSFKALLPSQFFKVSLAICKQSCLLYPQFTSTGVSSLSEK